MKSNSFKRLGSGFLAAIMVFGSVPVHANSTYQQPVAISAQAPQAPTNFFGATFSSRLPGEGTGNISIESVEVTVGGEYQIEFRHMFGGRELYRGENGGIFTPSRVASLSDHGRRFTIHTNLTAEQVSDVVTLQYRFGGIELHQWLGSVMFDSANPDDVLVHLASEVLISNDDGSYTLESVVEFRSPAGAADVNGLNIPFEGYRQMMQGANQFAGVVRHLIGTFDFTVEIGGAIVAAMPIEILPYDDFHTWDDIVDWAMALRSEAGSNNTVNRGAGSRYVSVETIGHSGRGRPILQIVVAANENAVNTYLNDTRRRMSSNLADAQALRAEGGANHRLPIYITNIHPDEFAGVDAQLVLIDQLLSQSEVFFHSADEVGVHQPDWPEDWFNPDNFFYIDGGVTRTALSVDELLENFIFIFIPTNNPDGRHYMRRGTFDGFDTNRDAAFQVHEETRALTTQVAKWSPLAQLDLHGHVPALLIEPTTGPHNINNEYDLLLPAMLEGAHAMGQAAIAGGFNTYMIPLVNMSDGWDDAGPMYLPVFLTLFGVKGFTIEYPDISQDSVDISIGMVLSYAYFAMNNFDELFQNKLDIKIRGLSGDDNRAVDAWFTDRRTASREASEAAALASLTAMSNPLATIPTGSDQHIDLGRQPGRDASPTGNFFPEFWVIPMDDALQMNRREALYTAGKFANHGVHIQELVAPVSVNGTTYEAGTIVINMRSAYRSYINSMMAPAANPHMYAVMYAESAIQFPAARGFRADALWVPQETFAPANLRTLDLAAPSGPNVVLPATQLPAENTTYVVVRNNSVDAISLINDLLRDGVSVRMLTETSSAGFATDVVVPRSALTPARLNGRFLDVTALSSTAGLGLQALTAPRLGLVAAEAAADSPENGQRLVALTASPARFPIMQMGFDYSFVRSVSDLNNINVLVVYGGNDEHIAPGVIAEADARGIPIVWIVTHLATNQSTGAFMLENDSALEMLFGGRGLAGGANQTGPSFQGGTFYGSFGTNTILTSHFRNNDTLYLHGARSWDVIPAGTEALFSVATGTPEQIFQGGFVSAATQAEMSGRYFGFTGFTNNDTPATVFGANILVRSHARAYWPMFGSAVFSHLADIDVIGADALVSVRTFAEAAGATVEWDADTATVIVTFAAGTAFITSEHYQLVNDRAMVSERLISTILALN